MLATRWNQTQPLLSKQSAAKALFTACTVALPSGIYLPAPFHGLHTGTWTQPLLSKHSSVCN